MYSMTRSHIFIIQNPPPLIRIRQYLIDFDILVKLMSSVVGGEPCLNCLPVLNLIS